MSLVEKIGIPRIRNWKWGTVTDSGQRIKTTKHTEAEIVFDATKPTTIPVRKIDNTKAMDTLGFIPKMNLENGISDTVKWYKNTFDF